MSKTYDSNMKSIIDSMILSAIYDFGAQIAQSAVSSNPDISEEAKFEILAGIFINMTIFLQSKNINTDSEYFQYWNHLFEDGGAC